MEYVINRGNYMETYYTNQLFHYTYTLSVLNCDIVKQHLQVNWYDLCICIMQEHN